MNGLACESLGLITATLTKSIEQAAVLSPVFILPMMLFAGFFVKQDSIPVILIPFKYLSIFKYSYQAYVEVFLKFNTLTKIYIFIRMNSTDCLFKPPKSMIKVYFCLS